MKDKIWLSISLVSLNGILTCEASKPVFGLAERRPNIILFMVDDMGWQDTSLPFWTEKTHYNMVYETPNMERLAKQGMMFTQAYACSVRDTSKDYYKKEDRN